MTRKFTLSAAQQSLCQPLLVQTLASFAPHLGLSRHLGFAALPLLPKAMEQRYGQTSAIVVVHPATPAD